MGQSKNLFEDFTSSEDIERVESILKSAKEPNGRKPRIVIFDRMRIGGGCPIFIEPDHRTVASPVGSHPGCMIETKSTS